MQGLDIRELSDRFKGGQVIDVRANLRGTVEGFLPNGEGFYVLISNAQRLETVGTFTPIRYVRMMSTGNFKNDVFIMESGELALLPHGHKEAERIAEPVDRIGQLVDETTPLIVTCHLRVDRVLFLTAATFDDLAIAPLNLRTSRSLAVQPELRIDRVLLRKNGNYTAKLFIGRRKGQTPIEKHGTGPTYWEAIANALDLDSSTWQRRQRYVD